jgi:hypothetical protein
MFRRRFTASVLCALPVLLAGCIVEGHQGGGYPTQPQPQPSYSPPPPAPQYIPGPPARVYAPPPPQVRQPPPPPPKRKLVRTANLTQYCKQRGFTGAGTKRNGQPVCIVTSMGFNTTYTSKVANINYADACRRQFRTSEYHLERGRVNCILYVD